MKESKLTPKQARFVAEYLIDLNATQAAIRAGYSAKTAEVIGHQNLRKLQIAAAIAEAQQKRAERTGITQERVLAETELLAFSDVTHYELDDLGNLVLAEGAPTGAMRAVQSIKRKVFTRGSGDDTVTTREVEFRMWDKPGPLKLAGQHVGLFTEKHEHTGKNGKPIEVVKRVVFGGRHRKQADGSQS
jgi:phage terminase small subunit